MQIKILLLSKNATLIKFLDQLYFLTKVDNPDDIFKQPKEQFHFIIIDVSMIKDITLSKIKDVFKGYLIICGSVEDLQQTMEKTKFCDDFFVIPFSPKNLQLRINMLYKKKAWGSVTQYDAYEEELIILKSAMDIYLNRIFLTVSNIATEDQQSDLVAYIKTIKLVHFVIYIMHVNKDYTNIFQEIQEHCKILLSIYNVSYEIEYADNFSFNLLTHLVKKYFILIFSLVLISCCGAVEKLKIRVYSTENHVYLSLSENLLDYNVFSNLMIKKILEKYSFISRDHSSIAIKLKL